mgnify:FL=1|jgi:hypothetical protein|tara:strand:+ start:2834 stop:3199 length:366 start_codon:yes stop_codon:yes gene_type:complete
MLAGFFYGEYMRQFAGKIGRRTGNYDPWARLSAAVLSQACLDYNKMKQRALKERKVIAAEVEMEALIVERFLVDEANEFVLYLEAAGWPDMTTDKLRSVVESVKNNNFSYESAGRQKLSYG